MNDVMATECLTVAKKTRTARPPDNKSDSDESSFDRIELQAPPGWMGIVDAAAKELGLSRSAFIRMAVNEKMRAMKS